MMSSSMLALSGLSLAPLDKAPPEQLVILLHGFGSNGQNLLELGRTWQTLLPRAEFIAYNAPFICASSLLAESYQWFDLSYFDQDYLAKGLSQAVPILNESIDFDLQKRSLKDDRLALVGFSQGAMMAMSTGLSRIHPCAGVLGYSGSFIYCEESPIRSFPNVMLIHGDKDQVIPCEHLEEASERLASLGVSVQTHLCKGLDHSIDATGLSLGGQFLDHCFSKSHLEISQA